MIDVTLACEDAYSKFVEAFTVADVSDEDVLATVCCRFGSWGLVIKLNFFSDFEHFGTDFVVEVQERFEAEVCCWCLVEVTELNPGQYSEARFGQDFNFRFSRDADVWLWFWS